jgi:hypothetical protein
MVFRAYKSSRIHRSSWQPPLKLLLLAQVTATLQGARPWSFTKPTSKPPLEFLEVDAADVAAGKKTEPAVNAEYEKWLAKDSQVRSYLFSSLSEDIFSSVASATTAAELWAVIQTL